MRFLDFLQPTDAGSPNAADASLVRPIEIYPTVVDRLTRGRDAIEAETIHVTDLLRREEFERVEILDLRREVHREITVIETRDGPRPARAPENSLPEL